MKKFLCVAALLFCLSIPAQAGKVYVVAVDVKFYDKGPNYTYYSWKADIHNSTGDDRDVLITVKLLDKAGFVLETTRQINYIKAWRRNDYTGQGMIKNTLAAQVKKAVAEVVAY